MPAAVLRQFAATRAQLDAACDLLLSPAPDALDRCAVFLETASRELEAYRSEIAEARGDAMAMEAAWQVRRSFLRAGTLLENAARFHSNWLSIRGAMAGGYTDRGEPAPVRHHARISLEA
jgi:hypothetical protein